MSATPTTPADEAPRELEADFAARLAELNAAQGFGPADAQDGPPAREEPAPPPTTAPARTPAEAEPAAPAAEDPVAAARREERERVEREYKARLDGVHGNVKQWQVAAEVAKQQAERLAAQLAEADKERAAEFKQLIDGAENAELRRYWEDRAQQDRERRELARERAQSAAERQAVEAERQAAAAQGERGARDLLRESLLGFIDAHGRERGLAPEDLTAIRADIEALPILGVLNDAPLNYALQSHQQTGRWLERRIAQAADARAARRAEEEATAAQANRRRDAQSGRFAAGQPGATGPGPRPDLGQYKSSKDKPQGDWDAMLAALNEQQGIAPAAR